MHAAFGEPVAVLAGDQLIALRAWVRDLSDKLALARRHAAPHQIDAAPARTSV